MQLSFLVQLILLFILTMCMYLVFTNTVKGRMKIIIIIFSVLLGFYLYSKLSILRSYNEFYTTPETAKEEYLIERKVLKKSDGQFAISVWIFIDDWNYKYGEEKIILRKIMPSNSGNTHLPSVQLDEYKNDLKVILDTFGSQQNSFSDLLKEELDKNGVSYEEEDDITCVDGKISINDEQTDVSCNNLYKETNEVMVENINMQKWVNIVTTVNNRSLDLYVNGKLIKTKTFNNLIDTNALNYGGIQVTPNGGFGGYISKVRYYPRYLNPQEVWDIYRDGYGDALDNTLNQYNMSVSLYKGQVEQNKIFLF